MTVSASVRKSWSDGFVADVALSGSGGPIGTIMQIDGRIEKSWGGLEFEDLGGGRYKITAPDLGPGETASGAFVAEGSAGAGIVFDEESDGAAGIEPAPEAAATDITVTPGITASELQALIDESAAGTTIHLAAGTYEFDRTIEIARSDIAVRGAGAGEVTIRVDSDLGQEAFRVGDGARHGDTTLARDAGQWATEITLSGDHGFEAGDFVYLERENTDDWLDQIGDSAWREDEPLRASIVEVRSVDGNTLTLASGLHFDFDRDETTVQEIDLATGVELGGFTVDYGLGEADPSNFSNTLWRYGRDAVIEVEGTSGLVLSDIAAHDVPSLGTSVALSREVDADGLTVTGAHNKGVAGNGYALQIRDVYDSSFTGLSDQDMRHSVVFASWRSAAGNDVHVESTDRDINFHGGRDHGNTVRVDRSIRDAESDAMSATVWINAGGTDYGAPTDPGANVVTVRHAVGSSRRDDITGDDAGAWLDGAHSHDILRGGAGDDVLIGGHGRDTLTGGAGEDVALYTGDRAGFEISGRGGTLSVVDTAGNQKTDTVSEVEWLVFDDAALRVSDGAVRDRGAVADLLAAHDPTSGADDAAAHDTGVAVFDEGGSDSSVAAIASGTDVVMLDHQKELELTGTADIDATGSSTADMIFGTDGRNVIKGGDGPDRIWARKGDDRVFGGSGDDELHGGGGADLIHGGGGTDALWGGGGDDVFRFDDVGQSAAGAGDRIRDFSAGDVVDLSRIDADVSSAGDQAFHWSGAAPEGAGSLWFAGDTILGDVDGDDAADIAIGVNGYGFGAGDFVL